MNYLLKDTLRIFLQTLYSKDSFELIYISPFQQKSLSEIAENDLSDCFYFTFNDDQAEITLKDFKFSNDFDFESMGYYIQKLKNYYSQNKEFEFWELINPKDKIESFFFLNFTGFLYDLNLNKGKRDKLLNFLQKYIKHFEKDELKSNVNYYPLKKNLKITTDIFKKYHSRFGSKFHLSDSDKIEFIELTTEEEYKLYESLFYLTFKDHIEIKEAKYLKINDKEIFDTVIKLRKIPEQIFDIENANITFVNLSVNALNGVATYKDNSYKFMVHGRAFKLLLELIKNPERKLKINKLYNKIVPEELRIENKEKYYIREYVREIKRKLNWSEDKDKDIDISIRENYILLSKNYPHIS